jgi:hypothetical protein
MVSQTKRATFGKISAWVSLDLHSSLFPKRRVVCGGEREGLLGLHEEMKIGTSYIFLASVNVAHSAPPALVFNILLGCFY